MVAVDFLRKSPQPAKVVSFPQNGGSVGLYKSAHYTRSLVVLSKVKML